MFPATIFWARDCFGCKEKNCGVAAYVTAYHLMITVKKWCLLYFLAGERTNLGGGSQAPVAMSVLQASHSYHRYNFSKCLRFGSGVLAPIHQKHGNGQRVTLQCFDFFWLAEKTRN